MQDGWNRSKASRVDPQEGKPVQMNALVAFDFARAYGTVNHRILRLRFLEMGVPAHYVNWIW